MVIRASVSVRDWFTQPPKIAAVVQGSIAINGSPIASRSHAGVAACQSGTARSVSEVLSSMTLAFRLGPEENGGPLFVRSRLRRGFGTPPHRISTGNDRHSA
jgi:hypothetical protein